MTPNPPLPPADQGPESWENGWRAGYEAASATLQPTIASLQYVTIELGQRLQERG